MLVYFQRLHALKSNEALGYLVGTGNVADWRSHPGRSRNRILFPVAFKNTHIFTYTNN